MAREPAAGHYHFESAAQRLFEAVRRVVVCRVDVHLLKGHPHKPGDETASCWWQQGNAAFLRKGIDQYSHQVTVLCEFGGGINNEALGACMRTRTAVLSDVIACRGRHTLEAVTRTTDTSDASTFIGKTATDLLSQDLDDRMQFASSCR